MLYSKKFVRRPPVALICVGCTGALAPWLGAGFVSAQESAQTPAAATAPAAPADAQTAPAQQQTTVTTVTVVAPTPGYRSTIDRRSYSIANDLQKSSGSLGDVMRDVPSVQVDVDGVVSLRGDTSVTILVDGKPSALFSGPGRAQAIQSISAAQYDRIEVMTTPPAGVTAEGSGGVINLISKATPKGAAAPAATGTIKANVGTGDRFDVGADGVYSGHGLSLTGGADLQRSGFLREVGSSYGLPGQTTGALIPATGLKTEDDREDALTLYGTAGYDLGKRDHLDADLNVFSLRLVDGGDSRYQTAAAAGALALDYDGPSFLHSHLTSISESLGLAHTLPGDGQSLSVKLSLGQGDLTNLNGATYDYQVPVQPSLYQRLTQTASFPDLDLKIDYKTLLQNKAKLSLGYESRFDWQSENDQGLQGASAAVAVNDSAYAQRFTVDQQVHSVYATYEQVFDKLTVQPGLRLEATTFQTDLVSSAQTERHDYFEAYPSLHLDYQLDDTSEIKASYGRRVRRPEASELDPFPVYSSPTLYTAGNSNLKPGFTQSYEFGYEYHQKSTDLQATLFYRDKSDQITTVTQDVGDNVLLQTYENIGQGHDIGLELVANRDLSRTLSFSASTDIMHSAIDATNLGLDDERSAMITSGQATVNWHVTPGDFVQLGGQAQGRRLTAQGYRGGAVFSNFGWRHSFNSRLAGVLTADNPFGLSRRTVVIDTPTLVEVDKRKFNNVALFLGLTYALGAAPKTSGKAFDFGGKGSGGQ